MKRAVSTLIGFCSCSLDVNHEDKSKQYHEESHSKTDTKDKKDKTKSNTKSGSNSRRKSSIKKILNSKSSSRKSNSKSVQRSRSKSRTRTKSQSGSNYTVSSMGRPSVRKLIDELNPSEAAVFEQIIKVPLLKLFPVKQKTEIAQKMSFNTYQKDEIIIRENTETTDFFILIEGACDVFYNDNFVNTLRKYDYCGEQAFLSAKSKCVHHTTVKVATDKVLVLQLNETDFELFRKGPIFFIQRNNEHSIQPEYLYRPSWFEQESMLQSDADLNSEASLWAVKNINTQKTEDINLEILKQYDESEYSLNHLIQNKSQTKTIISNWIESQLKGHLLFQFLFQSQLTIVAKCFREIQLSALEFINKSENQSLFLVGKGSVTEWEGDTVNRVFSRGDFFGSENIVFDYVTVKQRKKNNPNSTAPDRTVSDANVVLQTVSDTVLYELDRLTYKRLMAKLRRLNRNKIINFLRQIPLFASLLSYEIELLANTMVIREYQSGELLTLKGDECPFWFLIMRGKAYVSEQRVNIYSDDDRLSEDTEYTQGDDCSSDGFMQNHNNSGSMMDEIMEQNGVDSKLKAFFKSNKRRKKKQKGTKRVIFGAKDYFGETELIYNTSCRKTIVAETNVCCLCICSDEFKYVLGPLESVLTRGIAAEILHEEEQFEGGHDNDHRIKNNKNHQTNIKLNNKLSLLKWSLNDFQLGPFVGRGKFAQVRLVINKKTKKLYALKSVHKSFVFSKSGRLKKYCLKVLFNERDGLRQCSVIDDLYNKFITKLFGTFKDNKFVYLLLECGVAGDFGSYLNQHGHFNENDCRFYSACLISAVYHIHRLDLVHRDIKPENLVLTSNGYLKLTDFGFTKKLRKGRQTYTLCGTIGYIAPEIILEKGYNKTVDWFAVGCFLFHILTGSPPFPSREQQFDVLRSWCSNHQINGMDIPMINIPKYLSKSVIDLLHKILEYKPVRRWGYDLENDMIKIKNHKWFNGDGTNYFDWDSLINGTIKAPKQFPINPKKPFDVKHFSKHKMIKSQTHKFRQFKVNKEFQNWDKDF